MLTRDEAREHKLAVLDMCSIGMASNHAALHWQYGNVGERRATRAVVPEGRTATEKTDAEIPPIRRSGESKLG